MAIVNGLDQYGSATGLGDFFGSDSGSDVGGPTARSWRDLASGRADPLWQFDWDILIKPPSPIVAIDAEYIEEIQVPMPKFDSESVTYQARKYYYAKFEEFGVATLKIYEDNRMTSIKKLRGWQSQIKDTMGNYRVPKAYKGSIFVWPRDAKQTNIAKMELVGIFPTVVPNITFGSANERVVIDVEFSVDYVNLTFLS